MKILFVAVFNPTSTNTAQADGFEVLGNELIRFNFREIASQIGWEETCNKLISECEDKRPDLVVFSKCHEIQLRAWSAIKNTGAIIAHWYMDPMSNYSQEVQQRSSHSDMVFCALWEPYEYAKNNLNTNSFFLHEGYDHLSNFPVEPGLPMKDVTFIGNLRTEHRSNYYNAVGFQLIQNAFGLDHSRMVCSSKINLNFTEGGCSDRVYKVLASKGFLLTEPWPNMSDDFEPGVDFAVFNGVDELKSQIDYYLRHPEERNAIAESGYKKVQKFSRINWARTIVDKANAMKSGRTLEKQA